MSKLYNLEYLEEISAGDKEFIADMLNDFVTQTPQTLADIDVQIKQANWYELYKIIHKFIPTFEFVGAENVRTELRVVEQYAKTSTQVEKIAPIIEKLKVDCRNIIHELKTDFNL
jgi:HPt (histidine-containing phosphotransfer) domain-containing protein